MPRTCGKPHRNACYAGYEKRVSFFLFWKGWLCFLFCTFSSTIVTALDGEYVSSFWPHLKSVFKCFYHLAWYNSKLFHALISLIHLLCVISRVRVSTISDTFVGTLSLSASPVLIKVTLQQPKLVYSFIRQ